MAAEPRPGQHPSPAQAGSVAILALWSVVIIGLLAAAATMTTRTELRVADNALAESRARHAAEAGTQLGLARLLRRRAEGVAVFDGTPESWRDGADEIEIAIIDEAGKVDLNAAPLELLAGLLTAVGRPPEEAILLACNILDHRGGATAGCPEPAVQLRRRNQPFLVPEELGQIPGFDAALYDAVADFVTIASRASAIDPLVAPRPVLMAIPGATEGLVDTFLESRARWHDAIGAGSALGPAQAMPFVTTSPAREFTIKAVASAGPRARYRADLLIRLTGRAAQPYEVLATRAPPADRGKQAPTPPRVP